MKNPNSFLNFINKRSFPYLPVVASSRGCDWDSRDCVIELPVPPDFIDQLSARDVLVLHPEDEVVVIKSVSYIRSTICLYHRGFGASSAVAHGTKPFLINKIDRFTKRHIDRAMTPIGIIKKT